MYELLRFWWKPTSKNAYRVLIKATSKMSNLDLSDSIEYIRYVLEAKEVRAEKLVKKVIKMRSEERVRGRHET